MKRFKARPPENILLHQLPVFQLLQLELLQIMEHAKKDVFHLLTSQESLRQMVTQSR